MPKGYPKKPRAVTTYVPASEVLSRSNASAPEAPAPAQEARNPMDGPRPVQIPPKAGMSPEALRRCRRLKVSAYVGDGPRWKLEVLGPEGDNRILAHETVRTPQDFARVKRAWMGKYRIPPENVTEAEDHVPSGAAN